MSNIARVYGWVRVDRIICEWDNAAKAYSEFEETSRYSHFCREFVADHFADISNRTVLDAGCGNGEYTHILTENGGTVTGCDASVEMLKIAKEKYLTYPFDTVNLMEKLPYQSNSFDILFCHLVLMDIDPIDTALSEFYRVVQPNGIFFFSICHPAFFRVQWEKDDSGRIISKKMKEYITPGHMRQDLWGKTTHFHRTISHYFKKISQVGFVLNEMFEPIVYEEPQIPDIPLYLFAEFRKG